MHFVATLAAVGSIASLASARVGFQFPESVPLSKRQVTGPAYECHANCGYTIQDAAQDGYCESTKWKTQFDNCMDCANTYNIWRYYGEKVSAAAQKCGLTANPKPSGAAGGGSSSASAPATTATPSAPASSAPASSAPASSSAPATQPPVSTSQASAPGQTSQSATAPQTSAASSSVKSTAVATTGRPTASAAPTSGSNTTSTQIQVGAANLQQPAMLAAGAVALFAVNMI